MAPHGAQLPGAGRPVDLWKELSCLLAEDPYLRSLLHRRALWDPSRSGAFPCFIKLLEELRLSPDSVKSELHQALELISLSVDSLLGLRVRRSFWRRPRNTFCKFILRLLPKCFGFGARLV